MIGVIGGTGIYDAKSAGEAEVLAVKTPYGDVPGIKIVDFSGARVAFLPRHGKSHTVPPHMVNYRANIYALKEAGVTRVIALNSVGAVNKSFAPGSLVLPHDFLDFTSGRESTYFDKKVVHVDVSSPYCPQVRGALLKAAGKKAKIFDKGVYACTQGPRFETPAEIKMINSLGGDIVGMTGVPEVVLARELEMCYASLCIVANYAAGISTEKLTATEVGEIVSKNEGVLRGIVAGAVKNMPPKRGCGCGSALSGAGV